MALGLGFGSFASGLSTGLGTGQDLANTFQVGRDRRERRKAYSGAKDDYNARIQANVDQQKAASDPNVKFDEKSAKQLAEQAEGSWEQNLYGQYMPNIIDVFVKQGDLESADTLQKWSEDKKERQFMKQFGRTIGYWEAGRASGDYEQFGKGAVDLLNRGNYDGIKANGYEIHKNSEGQATGISFNLEDGGVERQHTFNTLDEAANFLMSQGSPLNKAQQWQAQREAADKLQSKRIESAIGLGSDISLERERQSGRMDVENLKHDNQMQRDASTNRGSQSKVQQDFEFMSNVLAESGFSEEEIRAYVPAMLKIGEYRKGKSPQEFAQQIVLELTKDPMMANKSPQEIQERALQLANIAFSVGMDAGGQTRGSQAPVGLGATLGRSVGGGQSAPRSPQQGNVNVYFGN
jgi:hypothetical protein